MLSQLAGRELSDGPWGEALGQALLRNELVFQTAEALAHPMALGDLPSTLQSRAGRPVSEAEILCWLTLGAAARLDGRPLLRPVVHGLRYEDISGAVVDLRGRFQQSRGCGSPPKTRSSLTAVDAPTPPSSHILVPTCGQHYFVAFSKTLSSPDLDPGWRVQRRRFLLGTARGVKGGKRLILVDHIVGGDADEDLEEHDRLAALPCVADAAQHSCSWGAMLRCGTAGSMVQLYAVRQKERQPGYLSSCLSMWREREGDVLHVSASRRVLCVQPTSLTFTYWRRTWCTTQSGRACSSSATTVRTPLSRRGG